MKNDSKLTLLIFAFATIYIVWGTTYLAMRIAVETIPPFMMAGVRFLLAGGVTFLFLKLRRSKMPTMEQWKNGAIVGLFLMVGGNGLVCWAEQEIPSGIAALVVASMPMWMCIFDWLLFKGTRPGGFAVVGLLMGFVGIGLLFGPSIYSDDAASLDLLSLLVLMCAPIFWSIGSLYSRKVDMPKNAFMSTSVQFITGGTILMIGSLILGEWWSFQPGKVSGESVLAMLYLAVFGSIIALSTYVWLLKQTTPSRVSTYTYVNPIIAVFLGWLILDEKITTQTIIAICIIVGSVVLVVVSRSQPKNKPQQELVELQKDSKSDARPLRQPIVENTQCKA